VKISNTHDNGRLFGYDGTNMWVEQPLREEVRQVERDLCAEACPDGSVEIGSAERLWVTERYGKGGLNPGEAPSTGGEVGTEVPLHLSSQ
jgi:Pyruvate/2-oxoacid:ferredoxin oxidoreductase delta subunit